MTSVQELLVKPAPANFHRYLFHYGKTFPVPHVGDILRVTYRDIGVIYILVTSFFLGSGKTGMKYRGHLLFSSPEVTERSDFELSDRVIMVNPRDVRVCDISIMNF